MQVVDSGVQDWEQREARDWLHEDVGGEVVGCQAEGSIDGEFSDVKQRGGIRQLQLLVSSTLLFRVVEPRQPKRVTYSKQHSGRDKRYEDHMDVDIDL